MAYRPSSKPNARFFVYYLNSFEPLILQCKQQGIGSLAPPEETGYYFYQNDPNGMPLRLYDAQGDIAWSAHYTIFGQTDKLDETQVKQPLRLQGQYFDEESGLHYNRYRYYDPATGVFVSQDPIGLVGGINLYQFAVNTLLWFDPWGLQKTTSDGAGNVVSLSDYGVPTGDFVPKPGIGPYQRPGAAGPTTAQKNSVQGKPCVICGTINSTMVADHIDPLAVEYYRTGQNDIEAQTSTDAVQPHCASCSSSQGGKMSAFSKKMKKILSGK